MKLVITGIKRDGTRAGKIETQVKGVDALEDAIVVRKQQLKVGPGGVWDIFVDDGETQMMRQDHQRVGFREASTGEFA